MILASLTQSSIELLEALNFRLATYIPNISMLTPESKEIQRG